MSRSREDDGVADDSNRVELSEAEWQQRLTPEQFMVLRRHGTERAGTNRLNHEHRTGTYHCAGCDAALFQSQTKYDSGSGWPSFWAPIKGAVETRRDVSHGMFRTEVRCATCGGHLGHVFDDGPRPTGQRYCMNGTALSFAQKPAEGTEQ
jgi:peptide-methionine (R)-S-oxide reductase